MLMQLPVYEVSLVVIRCKSSIICRRWRRL